MKWPEIKQTIREKLISRNLSTPDRRLNELDNLEEIFNKSFPEIIVDPRVLSKKDKEEFKREVSVHKKNGKFVGAENSLINEIYKQITPLKKTLAQYTPKELKEMGLEAQSALFEEAIINNLRNVPNKMK
jgi:tRNA U54 and U55 pseudouridine synthase Pus10